MLTAVATGGFWAVAAVVASQAAGPDAGARAIGAVGATAIALPALTVLSRAPAAAVVLVFALGATGFAASPVLTNLAVGFAGPAATLGASLAVAAFNIRCGRRGTRRRRPQPGGSKRDLDAANGMCWSTARLGVSLGGVVRLERSGWGARHAGDERMPIR